MKKRFNCKIGEKKLDYYGFDTIEELYHRLVHHLLQEYAINEDYANRYHTIKRMLEK